MVDYKLINGVIFIYILYAKEEYKNFRYIAFEFILIEIFYLWKQIETFLFKNSVSNIFTCEGKVLENLIYSFYHVLSTQAYSDLDTVSLSEAYRNRYT